MERRTFLKTGIAASAGVALGVAPRLARAAEAGSARWRKFEMITRIEVADASGATRAWIPVPRVHTDYQKVESNTFTGNAASARLVEDDAHDATFVAAEWPAGEKAPRLEITSRFATRDRSVDLTKPPTAMAADEASVARYLKPSKLIPVDGVVLETAQDIVRGQKSDVDRARAIYEWIVENTFRDPKVRGCGIGDIKTMLETRYFGGKCADLNALYVGLARAAGLPARDVYGLRVADSGAFKSLGKSGDVSKAQHCRAEVYLKGYGWVAVDPADVRKVVLEEPPGGRTLADPLVQKARAKLFGAWEMNWVGYNYSHDVELPGATGGPVGFLMYPQAETEAGRRDSLDPSTFRYTITSKELTA
jgi:transglutaminase-like putative cysteine protease